MKRVTGAQVEALLRQQNLSRNTDDLEALAGFYGSRCQLCGLETERNESERLCNLCFFDDERREALSMPSLIAPESDLPEISEDSSVELIRYVQEREVSDSRAMRLLYLISLAEGWSKTEFLRKTKLHPRTVSRWRKELTAKGIVGFAGMRYNRSLKRRVLGAKTEKKCSACDSVKDIKAFRQNTHFSDGFDCYCDPCRREIIRQRYSRKARKIRSLANGGRSNCESNAQGSRS